MLSQHPKDCSFIIIIFYVLFYGKENPPKNDEWAPKVENDAFYDDDPKRIDDGTSARVSSYQGGGIAVEVPLVRGADMSSFLPRQDRRIWMNECTENVGISDEGITVGREMDRTVEHQQRAMVRYCDWVRIPMLR